MGYLATSHAYGISASARVATMAVFLAVKASSGSGNVFSILAFCPSDSDICRQSTGFEGEGVETGCFKNAIILTLHLVNIRYMLMLQMVNNLFVCKFRQISVSNCSLYLVESGVFSYYDINTFELPDVGDKAALLLIRHLNKKAAVAQFAK